MRQKVHWFRAQAPRRPEEVAGALGLVLWGVSRRMLARLRHADFDIDAGPPYFAFLAEALAFAIQVAWRAAYGRYDDAGRAAFAQALAHDVARILAENEAELLGAEPVDAVRERFIALLNRRFEEYADFGCGPDGPDFAFLRYFASLLHDIVPEKDRAWIHDQAIALEGPEAAAMVARAVDGLLDTGAPGRAPAAAGVGE